MKASLDHAGCIGCGLCAETCPSVFRMADDGMAEAYVTDVPVGDEAAAEDARDNCPVTVITVE